MVEHRNARFAADPLIIAQAPHDTHIALCSHAANQLPQIGRNILTCVGGFCGCHGIRCSAANAITVFRLVRLYQYAASIQIPTGRRRYDTWPFLPATSLRDLWSILDGLEEQVRAQSGKQIVLNARNKAVQFYCRHGYRVEETSQYAFRRGSPRANAKGMEFTN
jgi:rhodanese-related sulfurtransferase